MRHRGSALGLIVAVGITVAMIWNSALNAQPAPTLRAIATFENPAPGISKIESVLATFVPGAQVVRKPNPRTAICYVLEGMIQIEMGGKTTVYGPGTTFILPKGNDYVETNTGGVPNVQLVQLVWH